MACGSADTPSAPALPVPSDDVDVRAGADGLVVVLPPADGLAAAERARIRLLVERVVDARPASDVSAIEVLEPVDGAALLDTVERAVRRVGAGGTVCVVGAELRARIAPVLALYPATRGCLVPTPYEGAGLLTADVDLGRFGGDVGAAARAAAGDGTVVVLDGGDVLLDARWDRGLAASAGATAGAGGALHTVRSAEELLALLDDQAALVATGVEPGSREARTEDGELLPRDLPATDALPVARTLPLVAVVVLDASPEAALLVTELALRGVRVIAPRSLLQADGAPRDTVVLSWRVRWDVPLGDVVARARSGSPSAPPVADAAVELEPGPAAVTP